MPRTIWGNKECDFVVRTGTHITSAYQVTLSLSQPDTRKREMAGLKEAMTTYHLTTGYIITLEEEETIQEDGLEMKVLPAWKWMLQ